MKKVKTSELTGAALDWAVAKCESIDFTEGGIFHEINNFIGRRSVAGKANWSLNWSQGGPIIERELLHVSPEFGTDVGWHWVAYVLGPGNLDENHEQRGQTPLIAAMRCYVASKLGDTVDVPDKLIL